MRLNRLGGKGKGREGGIVLVSSTPPGSSFRNSILLQRPLYKQNPLRKQFALAYFSLVAPGETFEEGICSTYFELGPHQLLLSTKVTLQNSLFFSSNVFFFSNFDLWVSNKSEIQT